MVIDNELFTLRHKQQDYLIYLTTVCEQESEGSSGWMYYAVCHGADDKELIEDWIYQCKRIYGIDLTKDIRFYNNEWHCWYYKICKQQLPSEVYGDALPLIIKENFISHT